MPNVAYPPSAGHPVQVVGTIHQPAPPTNKTVQVYSGTVANLEKTSIQTHCNSCNNEIYTRVNDKISQNGICWAVTCCFCGSWLLSLLVLCMDAFKVYRHFCPACNAFIGEYSPKMSGGMICLLIFLSLLAIGLQIFVVMVYLNRSYYWIKRIHLDLLQWMKHLFRSIFKISYLSVIFCKCIYRIV